jgi:polyhydroxybutyrate depolymerase
MTGCNKKDPTENDNPLNGTYTKSIDVNGKVREYLIHIPNAYDGTQSVPIMLNFHGWSMSASDQMNLSDMRALSESEQFILAYPQGALFFGSTHWNVGSWTRGSTSNDIGFISDLIIEITANYNIDENRIYACGYSNGGFFSQELACQFSDKIAAIGTVASNMSERTRNTCNPTHPTAIITISGTTDTVVLYDGSEPEETISHSETINYWIDFNNTDTSAVITNLPNSNTTDGSSVKLFQYFNGDNNVEIEHYKVINGGHGWPGVLGNMDIDTNFLIWNFVSQFDIHGKI